MGFVTLTPVGSMPMLSEIIEVAEAKGINAYQLHILSGKRIGRSTAYRLMQGADVNIRTALIACEVLGLKIKLEAEERKTNGRRTGDSGAIKNGSGSLAEMEVDEGTS